MKAEAKDVLRDQRNEPNIGDSRDQDDGLRTKREKTKDEEPRADENRTGRRTKSTIILEEQISSENQGREGGNKFLPKLRFIRACVLLPWLVFRFFPPLLTSSIFLPTRRGPCAVKREPPLSPSPPLRRWQGWQRVALSGKDAEQGLAKREGGWEEQRSN